MENLLDNDYLVKVSNRGSGVVSYVIKDMNNLYRAFYYRETKEVPMKELRALSFQPGGLVLLKDYLIVEDEAAARELFGEEVEPEYSYTEDDVKELLLHGSLDQLKDCLDFAPQAVLDLVQMVATSLKINDISKREAIKAKTGYDVTKAIQIEKELEEEDELPKEDEKKRRAASIKQEPTTPIRRTTAPKYNVVK